MSRVLRAELHCHTVYSSDGHISFDALARMAKRRALDVVAITDHDTIEGAADYRRYARSAGLHLELVVGEERTLSDGTHLIGLFLKEALSSDTLADAAREIQEQGGRMVLPHPFRRDGILSRSTDLEPVRAAAVEVFNPKCSYEENRSASRVTETFPRVGGSDAHYASELGECVVEAPVQGSAEESLRRVLAGSGPVRILGIPQVPGDEGRKYAELYYRYKRYVRVPRALIPAANLGYRWYRNAFRNRRPPRLEAKYIREEEAAQKSLPAARLLDSPAPAREDPMVG